MNEESKQRINRVTAGFMITIAAIFDLAQIASKLFALMGITEPGGALGQLGCHYANIDFPGTCKVVGAGVGTAIKFIPIAGPILETATRMVGVALSELSSGAFMLIGYATMYLWFSMRGAPVFSGKNIQQKAATAFIAFLVDAIPFLNVAPGITLWTIRMIMITRSEDKENAKSAGTGYNGKNFSRMRRPLRRYVHAKT